MAFVFLLFAVVTSCESISSPCKVHVGSTLSLLWLYSVYTSLSKFTRKHMILLLCCGMGLSSNVLVFECFVVSFSFSVADVSFLIVTILVRLPFWTVGISVLNCCIASGLTFWTVGLSGYILLNSFLFPFWISFLIIVNWAYFLWISFLNRIYFRCSLRVILLA